jgi:prolyl-tRNA synthetase
MKGVPLRLEVGPKDIEKLQVVIARRDTGEKKFIKKENIVNLIPDLLDSIQNNLFEQAKQFRINNTHTASTYAEFKDIVENKGGFIRCGWDGTSETETAIKNETKATIRVIPFDENTKGLNCIFSGKPAKHEVIFAKAY